MRLRLPRVVLVCLPMLSLGAGQTPFRVDVKLIDVSVSVRDGEGRLVTDLGQDDFDISEDGVPQKIAFFARSQDVPLNLGLIVDFSGSQGPFIKPHHKDLEAFLGSVLGPADRVFLLCFGNYLRLSNCAEITWSVRPWENPLVPLAVKLRLLHVQPCHLLVWYFDACWIDLRIKAGLDT